MDARETAKAFRAVLKAAPNETSLVTFDAGTLRAIWSNWKNNHPTRWWEAICGACGVTRDELIKVLLNARERLAPVFPVEFFGKVNVQAGRTLDKWLKAGEAEYMEASTAYRIATNREDSKDWVQNVKESGEMVDERIKGFFTSAMAYQLFVGDTDGRVYGRK